MKGSDLVKISLSIRVISWFFVIFLIPLQIILQKQLRHFSKHFLQEIQNQRTASGVDFFTLFTYIGHGSFLVAGVPIIQHFLDPKLSSTLIIFTVIIHYLANLFSLLFHEPRPFWYSSGIRGEVCQIGYSNPVHTVLILGTILPILCIEAFHKTKYRYIAYGCMIMFIFFGSFNGVYLGENFPHQVIITLLLDFALVTVYFSLSLEFSEFCYKSCYDHKENRRYFLYWIVLVFGLFVLVSVVQVIIHVRPANYDKLVSNALKHCRDDYEVGGTYNYQLSLEIFYALGFIGGTIRNSKKMSIYWMTTIWWKSLIRCLVNIGVNTGIYFAFRAVPGSDLFVKGFFHMIVPYFLMSYFSSAVLPLVFEKCKLTNRAIGVSRIH